MCLCSCGAWWRSCIHLLVAAFLLVNDVAAQADLKAERIALVRGDVEGVSERLSAFLAAAQGAAPLERARAMELLGEQYYGLGDIVLARQYWDQAHTLRVETYGDSAAEAAVGQAYRARYLSYMAANQKDQGTVALRSATTAKQLMHQTGNCEPTERVRILREYAYAFKVAGITTQMAHPIRLALTRTYFREALQEAVRMKDTIWIAQVTHDIGNAFNDEAHNQILSQEKNFEHNVDSALHYYRRSIDLMTEAGYGTSEAVMMDHYAIALLYRAISGGIHYEPALAAFDEALRTFLRQVGHPADVDPFTYDQRIKNPAQVIELLNQRAQLLAQCIKITPNGELVDHAIRNIEAAVPYWEQMMSDYHGTELEKVIGTYNHSPFRAGAELYHQRYLLKHSPEDLYTSLLWNERNRTTSYVHKRMREGTTVNGFLPDFPESAALKAPHGAVIVIYNHFFSPYVIDEQGLSTVPLEETSIDIERGEGTLDEFAIMGRNGTYEAYTLEAFRWYQELLGPVLAGRTEPDLIIVPYGNLGIVPFGALATSPLATNWSDVPFLGTQRTVRYARTITEALATETTCTRTKPYLATAHAENLAELPFARSLLERLHKRFSGSTLDLGITRSGMVSACAESGSLHIAAHGVYPENVDAFPYFQLADGTWSSQEVGDAPMKRTLVVLSMCSSGNGRSYDGNGIMSLAHAFLVAGASSVVHTLWPVDDLATSEILQHFYDGLDDGLLASVALRQAKETFISNHAEDGLAHPFYWSGIVLTGADLRLEPNGTSWWWFAPVFAALIGGGLYRRSKRAKSSRERATT